MILKARHNFIVYPFFQKYSCRIIRKHFERVVVNGSFNDCALPVLVICNHISWWDGFWVMYLNVNVLRRKFHFMMREDQLRKYRFFNLSGGFSVSKNSRSMMESLHYTASLLENPANMVLLFPQGEIQSVYKQPIEFQKGIERILAKFQPGEIQVLFVANLVDYFSNRKPTLFMYLKEYDKPDFSHAALQASYNDFYSRSIAAQTNKNAAL